MLGQLVTPVGFVAGVLTGVLFAAGWRRARAILLRPRHLLVASLVVGFAVAAAVIYLAIGSHSAASQTSFAAASAAPGAAASAARSMELEAGALAARLGRTGGSEGDWTLLAQAYDFLGRPEDARRARAHLGAAGTIPVSQMSAATLAAAAAAVTGTDAAVRAPVPSASRADTAQADSASAAELGRRVTSQPGDANAWLALAELRRAQRDYPGARSAYEKVVELRAMSAQAWADYADVLGSLSGGSLSGDAAAAIDSALRIDPNNPKALWLKASQAHEEHRFSDALAGWRRLKAVLPPGSPDAPIIDANIAEAQSLAKGAPSPSGGSGPASIEAAAQVSGTVSLDARLSNRVSPQATLFIYAKAADSPGPPLAVLRVTPGGWPVSFHLDDSMAMLPSRRLSQFDKVIVEARISRSGQATPASGDLYVTSPVVHPAPGRSIALVINREIG
jgi:cytochrome c-type biogenesis protein CcmH